MRTCLHRPRSTETYHNEDRGLGTRREVGRRDGVGPAAGTNNTPAEVAADCKDLVQVPRLHQLVLYQRYRQ